LKSAIPSLQRVAVLVHREHSLGKQLKRDLEAAA